MAGYGCVRNPWPVTCCERPRRGCGAASVEPGTPGDGLGVIRPGGQRSWMKARTGWALEDRSGSAGIAGPGQSRLARLGTAARAAGRSQPGRRQIRRALMQVAGSYWGNTPFARDHAVYDALIDQGTSA